MNVPQSALKEGQADFRVATKLPFHGQQIVVSLPFAATLNRRAGTLKDRVSAVATDLARSRLLALLQPSSANERASVALEYVLLLPPKAVPEKDFEALELIMDAGRRWRMASIEQAAASVSAIRTLHWIYVLGERPDEGFGVRAAAAAKPSHVAVIRPTERGGRLDVMPRTPTVGYGAPNVILFCREK